MVKGRVCNSCGCEIARNELEKNHSICPYCGGYLRLHARRRIESLADKESFHEWDEDIKWDRSGTDKLATDKTYQLKLLDTASKHNISEAVITGEIKMEGISVAIGVMDTRFMMASMGYVVGEKVTRLFERATKKRLPVLLFCCSGGARMQEGITSLMQMSKTAIAVKKHSQKRLLYISILTNPTMGGVTASFATLADIILAEKNATVGFAGTRVIEQNVGERLPKEFQTAEFKVEKGFVDKIVGRENMREELVNLLTIHQRSIRIHKACVSPPLLSGKEHKQLSPWEKVQLVRSINRPSSEDFIKQLFDGFMELKGDRVSKDDHSIIGGIAMFHGMPVTVIGQEKGKDSFREAQYRNWGMAMPSGYRKAMRLMKQAEKFQRPVICFVDTFGAACGREAEEHGQASTIAHFLENISDINIPILSIIIGEACSGGALALCSGNEVWMLENSVYSVLSPEGYASILWKDKGKAKDAANQLKMEASDLIQLKIIDKVVAENPITLKDNMTEICGSLDREIFNFLVRYRRRPNRNYVREREQRFRKY